MSSWHLFQCLCDGGVWEWGWGMWDEKCGMRSAWSEGWECGMRRLRKLHIHSPVCRGWRCRNIQSILSGGKWALQVQPVLTGRWGGLLPRSNPTLEAPCHPCPASPGWPATLSCALHLWTSSPGEREHSSVHECVFLNSWPPSVSAVFQDQANGFTELGPHPFPCPNLLQGMSVEVIHHLEQFLGNVQGRRNTYGLWGLCQAA